MARTKWARLRPGPFLAKKKQVQKAKQQPHLRLEWPHKVVTTDAWSLDRQMGACCTVPVGMVLAAEEKAIDQEVDRFVKDVQ
jgi:hypothetical protein